MKQIFKSTEQQEQFKDSGFTVMPFLDPAKVEGLKQLAGSFPIDKTTGFYSTSYHPDLARKKKLDEEVHRLVEETLNGHFKEYQYLGSAFLYKQPGAEGEMPPHQDWTVVDEPENYSLTVWIPLQPTDLENGAIAYLKGSHKAFDQLRAPDIPFPYQGSSALLKAKSSQVFLQAGHAFVFNHALVHCSPPNTTGETRIALAIGLIPQGATLSMLYRKNGVLEKYTMPDDMFIRFPEVARSPQLGEKTGEFSFEAQTLSEQQVMEKINSTKTSSSQKIKPLFKDPEHQAEFEQNGFIVLPALEEGQIEELKTYYRGLGIKDELGYGFHVGMDQKDKKLVAEMVGKISSVALPSVKDYLVDVQLFTASFVVKEPNDKGVVPPHQDWTFVEDETSHCSVTCWIPLMDVNMDNGCIGLIKGSHRFFDHVRPSPAPQAPSPLGEHMFTIFPYLQLVKMKAGQALFFNNKTIHASPPNTTGETRLGIGMGLTQKEAEVRHYYLKPGTKNRLLKYKTDQAFYKQYDNPGLSKMYDEGKVIEGYELLEEVPFDPQTLSKEEWKTKMKAAGNEFNVPLVERMADLFDYNPDGTKKEPEPEEASQHSETEQVQEEKIGTGRKKGFVQRLISKVFG